MKSLKRKSIATLISFSLMLGILIPALPVAASNNQYVISNEGKSERILGGIAIFVAGVLVGYFVDGGIIYTSGHSAGEWTSYAIDWCFKHIEYWGSGISIHLKLQPDGSYAIFGGDGRPFAL